MTSVLDAIRPIGMILHGACRVHANPEDCPQSGPPTRAPYNGSYRDPCNVWCKLEKSDEVPIHPWQQSHITPAKWELCKPMLLPDKPGERKWQVDLREIINVILYLIRTGYSWRMLPHESSILADRLWLLQPMVTEELSTIQYHPTRTGTTHSGASQDTFRSYH